MAMNDSDNTGRVFFDRNIYTKQIYIEFFTITTEYIWYISVINGIGKAWVFRVYASNRSVYFYIYCFSETGFCKRFSQSIDDKIVLPLEILFPAAIGGHFFGKG